MGKTFSKMFGKKETRVLMVGLDAAGKSTILYKLKLGEIVSTTPTIGFNVEAIEFKNLTLSVWDIGGQDKIRPLWKHYYPGTHGLIFVIDCNDRDRIPKAKDELDRLLVEDDLKNCPLLILANKQDLPNSISVSKLTEQLGVEAFKNRLWHIQGSAATTGDGLPDAMDWFIGALKGEKKAAAAASSSKE